jgi:hypothetical protein
MATFKRLMIAVDMGMICKFIFHRGDFEVMDVEREFSAFEGTGAERKNQAEREILVANARVRSGSDSYLAIFTDRKT